MAHHGARSDCQARGFLAGLTGALVEFAREHFALTKPNKKTGKSRLKEAIEKRQQTGKIDPALAHLKPVPAATAHIWHWFNHLSAARGASFTVAAITWSDMDAYFRLHRVNPLPWEVDTLRLVDDAYLFSRTDEADAVAGDAKALAGRIPKRKPNGVPNGR